MIFPISNREREQWGRGRKTYSLVIKLAESMKDFSDHWRPRRYIFGLCIGLEFCVILEDAQSKSAESSVTTGYQRLALGLRE